VVAAISADAREETAAWQADEDPEDQLGFPLLSDPDSAVAKAYGVYDAPHGIALPAVFVIDREGAIRWRQVGESIADRPTAEAVLEQLADPEPGAPPEDAADD